MRTPTLAAMRTLAAAAIVAAAALSCPSPIDEELLLVVDDEIAPSINVASPEPNSTYRYSVLVTGTVTDSSRDAGDGAGFVSTLLFSVSNDITLDRAITFERDGTWTVSPPDPSFAYAPATGNFSFTVNTSALSNMRYFFFTVLDLNGNHGDHVVTVLPDPALSAGPEIKVDDAAHPCPNLYSSVVTTSLAMLGWIDPTHYQPGTASYIIEPFGGGIPRPEAIFTPGVDGEFSFTFNPQTAPRLAGRLIVRIYARDEAGRLGEAEHQLFDDSEKPLGTFTVAADEQFTNSISTLLSVGFYDEHSGMDCMRFRNDAEPFQESDWVSFTAGDVPWTLSATNGTRTVRAEFRDMVGNVSAVVTDAIFLDTVQPTVSCGIDGGASCTNDTSVSLTITATDPAPASGLYQMRFGTDGVTYDSWMAFASPHDYPLAGSDGSKDVYVQVRDNALNVRTASDDIVLDRSGPTGSLSINGGDAWTGSTTVTLAISASDAYSGVTHMRVHDAQHAGSWQAYETSRGWTFTGGDAASKTVYVDFRDGAGNERMDAAVDSIGLDTQDPSIDTFEINGGAGTTTVTSVTLTISASDDAPSSGLSEMKIWNDGESEPPGWQSYATSRSWTLRDVPGSRTVYMKVRDTAGNTDSDSDSITYAP